MYIQNTKINNQISFWLITMFWIVSIMIIVGGLTRLTDSGLSITKWQLFSGFLPPLNKDDWIIYFNLYKEIPEFKLQNFNMTLQEFKIIFWWEWVHRFLGRLIGICFLIPLIYFSFKIKVAKLLNLYFIFFLICFQGFIGWYMVSSGLIDRVDVSHFRLSTHLFIAFLILSLILWNYLKIKNNIKFVNKINPLIPFLFLILVFMPIALGAFVSGLDAGKIYQTWPMMGANYLPNDYSFVNFQSLFELNNHSLVQFYHRNLAYLIIVYVIFLTAFIYKKKMQKLYFSLKVLLVFLSFQVILGILTLITGLNIYLASAHQITSVLLAFSALNLYYFRAK